ncbi:inner membrane protein YhjD [Actinoplanes lutulentus]|uniref:Inner membrane protein YhjD n=1 Tax=Actinoplanes lutulentus TaxID=1287878 RepID=A0A327Z3C5_9ACTN|nr:YihY/virulence factor BrkB family protein [Actinoplanes lutulentus]MBB2946369.1 inner membrane protein YhjD [Actinoplanes lutulentus]RAK28691.1 inner membrane protein YhjD [Actinoplanes lutulentus]
MMSEPGRVDRFQRQHAWASFPLAVLYKFFDDQGNYLAALIAYYAFVSMFPLLLLSTTILGYALSGNPDLQHRILTSALSEFPIVGNQLQEPSRIGGGATGLVIGVLGALYGGLGVAQAVQYAMNTTWRIPRNNRPNPIKARGRSLLLLGTAGLAAIGTTTLSAFGSGSAGSLGGVLKIFLLGAAVLINAMIFVFAFRVATARHLSVKDVAPGAIGAAVVWQLLQTFGVAYVEHVVKGASATNGVFALVLGLLAFFYITAVAVVLCAEINVVRVEQLFPRALLTPFTDNVELTSGDTRAYTDQAVSQRSKGFENIDVTFNKPTFTIEGQDNSAAETTRHQEAAPQVTRPSPPDPSRN